ncbi:MAG: hypothetical protein OXE86_12610 [Alphaproteobacteria bacterium]|nr:hypothetical protein [Alphaproteobacteria bacterium]
MRALRRPRLTTESGTRPLGPTEFPNALTLGAIEIRTLSTTAEDLVLRRLFGESLGTCRACTLLAPRFPSGSALAEIEARKACYEEGIGRLDNAVKQGMIETLARELADLAMRSMQGP